MRSLLVFRYILVVFVISLILKVKLHFELVSFCDVSLTINYCYVNVTSNDYLQQERLGWDPLQRYISDLNH